MNREILYWIFVRVPALLFLGWMLFLLATDAKGAQYSDKGNPIITYPSWVTPLPGGGYVIQDDNLDPVYITPRTGGGYRIDRPLTPDNPFTVYPEK